MAKYLVGQQIRITVRFAASDTLTDPTAIIFKFKKPNGTITTYTHGTDAQLVKDSTGIYHVDLTLDAEGEWAYRWEGTGALVAADQRTVAVDKSLV